MQFLEYSRYFHLQPFARGGGPVATSSHDGTPEEIVFRILIPAQHFVAQSSRHGQACAAVAKAEHARAIRVKAGEAGIAIADRGQRIAEVSIGCLVLLEELFQWDGPPHVAERLTHDGFDLQV